MELQKYLHLRKPPQVIEFFDVSTLQGQYNVGAMIQMANGKFNKSQYRKLKIKWSEAQNDFAMMYEIVFRRYYRLVKEKTILPNLIVIDGGKGQLNAAQKALRELKLRSIDLFSGKKRRRIIFTIFTSAFTFR